MNKGAPLQDSGPEHLAPQRSTWGFPRSCKMVPGGLRNFWRELEEKGGRGGKAKEKKEKN